MMFQAALPEWLPWWAVMLAAIPAFVWALAFLLLPFNGFGVKDRLDLIDARLDEIQAELRLLNHRVTAAPHGEPAETPPPMRPAAREPDPPEPERPARAEPRLNWPR